jgi:uncharacterized protein (TIGR02266 family)
MTSPLAQALQQYSEAAVAPTPQRRAHERVPLQVEVTLESDHNFYTGLTSDISVGGVFVATHALWPIGTRVCVHLTLPGFDRAIQVDAEVRWIRDGRFSTLPPGIGVRFEHLPGDVLGALTRFVQRRDTIFYEE